MIFTARHRFIRGTPQLSLRSSILIFFAKARRDRGSRSQIASRIFSNSNPAFLPFQTEWGTTLVPPIAQTETRTISSSDCDSKFDTSAVPGRFFEMPDHFRIGMGVNTEMFAEGLNRIGRALR